MKAFLFLLLALFSPVHLAAQTSAEAEIEDAIYRMFDGMRAGDSTAVRAAVHPEARLMSVSNREGMPGLSVTDFDDFVAAVGTPHDEVWDERIWDLEIRVDGNLATAWMQYAFHLDDRLSHCGVNAIDLYRTTEGDWKVIHVTDTRRTEGCVVP